MMDPEENGLAAGIRRDEERSKEAAERSREAREYLLEYRSAKREAADMELRLTQLRLKYALPKAIQYSTMPSAHDHNRDLSDYMAAFEELEDYLIKKHTNCIGKEVDIYMRLDMMEDELERAEVQVHRPDSGEQTAELEECGEQDELRHQHRGQDPWQGSA